MVSVIVPIYHSESYLEHCCQSLFAQTLADVEYIFILDGPSDEAEAIINRVVEDYPLRRDCVRTVVHEKNKGISFSRQEGHDLAKGKYIFHCDSDDWMEPDALQLMVEKAEVEKVEVVYFDYTRHYETRDLLYRSEGAEQGEIFTIDAPLHNKLLRTAFIKEQNLLFPPEINWGEDLCMSVLCQILAKRVVYLPQMLYHRNMHQQSFTSQINKEKYMQLVACPRYIESELQKRGLAGNYTELLMQLKFEMKEYFLIQPQMRDIKLWKSIYPECHPYIWQFARVPFYLKFIASLITHSMGWMASVLLCCRDGYNRRSSTYPG